MKATLFSLFLLFAITANSQTRQPFSGIGKKVKVVTLTNGKYDEFFDEDTLQRIGSSVININTKKITKIKLSQEEIDELENKQASRFLSVDPLENKFAFYTPYQFAGNKPIESTDLDGLEEYHYTFGLDKQGKTFIRFADVEYTKKHSFLFWSWEDKIPERYVIRFNGATYYIGFGGAQGFANNGMQKLFKTLMQDPKFDARIIPSLFYSSEESAKFFYDHQANQLKDATFHYMVTGVLTGYIATPDGLRMLGSRGTQFESKTMWQDKNSRARIDAENFAPGKRPGTIHYQDENDVKYQYNVNDNKFYGKNSKTNEFDVAAPNKVNDLLKNEKFQKGIDKALKYLGEDAKFGNK